MEAGGTDILVLLALTVTRTLPVLRERRQRKREYPLGRPGYNESTIYRKKRTSASLRML